VRRTAIGAGLAGEILGAVDSVVVEMDTPAGHSTLSLAFDKAVSRDEADRFRTSLVTSAPQSQVSPAALNGAPLWCGSYISDGDSNGYFSIQYFCGGTSTLPWGFQISTAVKAIIVSSVNEAGLSWWRNGYVQAQNAPHVVPKDYQFHGTMQPVWARDKVTYQDFMTFRHNLGPGGTGTLTFYGAVELKI
jgi:hypothetical protein